MSTELLNQLLPAVRKQRRTLERKLLHYFASKAIEAAGDGYYGYRLGPLNGRLDQRVKMEKLVEVMAVLGVNVVYPPKPPSSSVFVRPDYIVVHFGPGATAITAVDDDDVLPLYPYDAFNEPFLGVGNVDDENSNSCDNLVAFVVNSIKKQQPQP